LDRKEVLKSKLAELVIKGDKRQQKRKLEQSDTSEDDDTDSDNKKIAVGNSSLDPIDLECEESKMLKQSLTMRDEHHLELLQAIRDNTKAVTEMHNDIVKYMLNK
jgi:hypothetical protein